MIFSFENRTLKADHVQMHARAGTELSQCIREAAIIALSENRKVRFVFNGETYFADPKEIRGLINSTADT